MSEGWVLPLAAGGAGTLAGAAGGAGAAGAGVVLGCDARRTSIRHVGHVCCLWNHDRRQL